MLRIVNNGKKPATKFYDTDDAIKFIQNVTGYDEKIIREIMTGNDMYMYTRDIIDEVYNFNENRFIEIQ